MVGTALTCIGTAWGMGRGKLVDRESIQISAMTTPALLAKKTDRPSGNSPGAPN